MIYLTGPTIKGLGQVGRKILPFLTTKEGDDSWESWSELKKKREKGEWKYSKGKKSWTRKRGEKKQPGKHTGG